MPSCDEPGPEGGPYGEAMGATTHSYCTGMEQKSMRFMGGVLTRSCMPSPSKAMVSL